MQFRYSSRVTPPGLIVPVVVSADASSPVIDVEARIDTGADMSVLPTRLRAALSLEPKSVVTTRGALGETWRHLHTFIARIRVAGDPWLEIEAVESPKEYILLGRDVLNRYRLLAGGPNQTFELTFP